MRKLQILAIVIFFCLVLTPTCFCQDKKTEDFNRAVGCIADLSTREWIKSLGPDKVISYRGIVKEVEYKLAEGGFLPSSTILIVVTFVDGRKTVFSVGSSSIASYPLVLGKENVIIYSPRNFKMLYVGTVP